MLPLRRMERLEVRDVPDENELRERMERLRTHAKYNMAPNINTLQQPRITHRDDRRDAKLRLADFFSASSLPSPSPSLFSVSPPRSLSS